MARSPSNSSRSSSRSDSRSPPNREGRSEKRGRSDSRISRSRSAEKDRSRSRREERSASSRRKSISRSISQNREVSKSREEKPRSRSASSSDVSDVDRTKPRLRRDRADSRGDKIIEEAVDGAVKKQRIVEPEDFLDDSLTMRLLYSVLERSGREFVEDVLYETVHSINQDVKSRRDIRIPQKYVGIRVKRIVQRKEDDMAFRRRFAARENRRRRERSYSRSSSRSRSRSRHHRISVSDMCDKYSLDAECEDRLRELTQEQLARVFGPDLLIRADCRNPSSIVMSRIRDAVRGRWRRMSPRRYNNRRRSYSRDRWSPSSSRSSRSYSRSPRRDSRSRSRSDSRD